MQPLLAFKTFSAASCTLPRYDLGPNSCRGGVSALLSEDTKKKHKLERRNPEDNLARRRWRAPFDFYETKRVVRCDRGWWHHWHAGGEDVFNKARAQDDGTDYKSRKSSTPIQTHIFPNIYKSPTHIRHSLSISSHWTLTSCCWYRWPAAIHLEPSLYPNNIYFRYTHTHTISYHHVHFSCFHCALSSASEFEPCRRSRCRDQCLTTQYWWHLTTGR